MPGGPHFVPRPGRKERRSGRERLTQRVRHQTPEQSRVFRSVQETAASAQEYSEYNSSQCPDGFIDSEDEDDELNDASSACQLG